MKRNEPETYFTILVLVVAIGMLMVYVISLYLPKSSPTPHSTITASLTDIQSPIGVWMWEDISSFSHDQLNFQLEQFSKARITDVYLNVEWLLNIREGSLSNEEKSRRSLQFTQTLSEYIALAQTYAIRIHALAGGPEWATESQSYIPGAILDIVLQYNRANPLHKFSGIQFDIEFHSSGEFKENQQEQFESFLNIVQNLGQSIMQYNATQTEVMSLGFAIPYWFDGQNANLEQVQYNGKLAFIAEHLMDILNNVHEYIVIMAYRDTVYGSNGIMDITHHERTYLAETQSPLQLLIAIETTDIVERHATFHGQAPIELIQAMIDIEKEMHSLKNFRGIVIHEANSYLDTLGTALN